MSGITVDETPVLVIQRNSDKTRQKTHMFIILLLNCIEEIKFEKKIKQKRIEKKPNKQKKKSKQK